MPNHPSFPTLFDDVLKINISDLKRWGYLKHRKSGSLQWSRNNIQHSSISIESNPYPTPRIKLSYKFNGDSKEYEISIVTIQSNLNKGEVPFFLCPVTNRRSRILYQVGGHFLHRDTYSSPMYESQTYSKHTRDQYKLFDNMMGYEKAYKEINSKHFKKFYKGKPTKRYIKLFKKIQLSESYSQADLENLIRI